MMTLIRTLLTILFAFQLSFAVASCNQPTPLQPECATRKNCYSCVVSGCAWCQGMTSGACWSFKAEGGCAEPVGFTQNCTDGTAIFPDPVVSPIPYNKLARDGGIRHGDAK